jgi:HPt (histidine-containing phosphotransfer) domain-containing protein
VKEMLELYIEDASKAVSVLTCALEGTACVWQDCVGDTCQDADGDMAKVPRLGDLDGLVHQLKGGSASLGAANVALACGKLRDAVKSGSEDGMRAAAREVCSTYRETEAVMAQLLRTMEDGQSESSSGSE